MQLRETVMYNSARRPNIYIMEVSEERIEWKEAM